MPDHEDPACDALSLGVKEEEQQREVDPLTSISDASEHPDTAIVPGIKTEDFGPLETDDESEPLVDVQDDSFDGNAGDNDVCGGSDSEYFGDCEADDDAGGELPFDIELDQW